MIECVVMIVVPGLAKALLAWRWRLCRYAFGSQRCLETDFDRICILECRVFLQCNNMQHHCLFHLFTLFRCIERCIEANFVKTDWWDLPTLPDVEIVCLGSF